MRIEVEEERLLIISDLHVGSPYSEAVQSLGGFLEYARRERFNLCINGDGFEILQSSFASLAHDSVELLTRMRRLIEEGLSVYYIVGNHDIVFEQFLTGWSKLAISPFLNVTSGDLRVRIEHGHLYDPSFVRSPKLYELLTRLATPILRLYPDVYRLFSAWEVLVSRLRAIGKSDKLNADVYVAAASMLARRGFDCVIFGHTHRAKVVQLAGDATYVNSGGWVRGGSYVEISDGAVTLKKWDSKTQKPMIENT